MLYPEFETLLKLGYRASNLNLMSQRRVRSIVSGDHRSPFRGKGLDFEEVRDYAQGDDVRNIDWRVTARTGRPHIKLFTEERERSVLICTDVNHTMRFGTRGTFKSIRAAEAAALLGWAASRENNRVGGSFFGNVPDGMMFLDPVRTRRSLWRILKQLCDRGDYHSDPVQLEDHLRYLNKAVPSGGLFFIISDFISITANLKKRISDLHRKADVVLVAVNDPADKYLPPVGPLIFKDRNNETVTIDTSDKKGGRAYERLWAENRKLLENTVNSLGLGYLSLTTEGDAYFDLANGLKRLGSKGGGNGRPAFAA